MKNATQKGRQSRSTVEHKGAVQKPRTQEQRPMAKGQDTGGSTPRGRSIPQRDKKTGKFLPRKKAKK